MNAQPKRQWDGTIATIPAPDHHMVIECKITYPPSAEGRTVYLHIPAEDVTDMLLALRDQAREMRR